MTSPADTTADVTALFIVRLRFEAGSSQPMRAEVRMTPDVTGDFQPSSTVTDADAVVSLLREWLRTSTPPPSPSP
jgi:hypothetical protein